MFCGTLTRRLAERTGEDQPWETHLCVEGADVDTGVPRPGSVKEYDWGGLGDRKLILAAKERNILLWLDLIKKEICGL